MKRLLLSLSLCCLVVFGSHATHLMGGEIIVSHISGNDYLVKLTTYRDTLGIPMQTSANFTVQDEFGVTVMMFTIPVDTPSGQLMPLYPYGVEKYCFTDTVTLPDTATYSISWSNCCRNNAILNMTSPGSESMYLTSTITNFGSANNSNPFFLVPPVIFLPVNTPWQYNPLPFDPNGDSLHWRIDTPLNAYNDYVDGYTYPPANPGGDFTIDPITGTISYNANTLGNFDAAVVVDEYRNGQYIGSIRRDMQLIVVATQNQMAKITNVSGGPIPHPDGYFYDVISAGSNYEFRLLADDDDALDNVNIYAYGEPFIIDNSPASFTLTPTGNGNEVEGAFSWQTNTQHVRRKTYNLVFRVTDGIFAFDESVVLKVEENVGIEGVDQDALFLTYPNPVTNYLFVPVSTDEAQEVSINIYSISGQVVSSDLHDMNSADEVVVKDVQDMSSGTYIVAVLDKNGKVLKTNRFVIER